MLRVDSHRHFGGSLSAQFIWDAIQSTGTRYLAESLSDVRAAMQFMPGEQHSFHRFLDKFRILDEIAWTEDLIDASIKQVSDDLIADRIDFTLMRFSINKYMSWLKWHRRDVVKFFSDSFRRHAPGRVGLILSLKYESPRASQKQLAALIDDPVVRDSVVGIDLVGDEAYFDHTFYGPLLAPWRDAGKIVMAHVGESQSVANVVRAVAMGVTDLCHGLAVLPRPLTEMPSQEASLVKALLEDYRERNICWHMAITSTYLTGVWTRPDWYPIVDLIRLGCVVTIGTDVPTQCSTTYDQEFGRLPGFGLTAAESDTVERNAVARVVELMPGGAATTKLR